MSTTGTEQIIADFTGRVQARLAPDRLDGPVRLDNTRTVVIIPLKDRGPIHAQLRRGLGDEGVADIVEQLQMVPSLKGLVLASY
ncbi:MAG TPA: hypothetical protein VKX16_02205 [Chloroflexota bacterium]|nr:hypothetical protein [Chloroflexota bacterium]